MKPGTGAHRSAKPMERGRATQPELPETSTARALSEREERVLEILRSSGVALSLRQLEFRIPAPATEVAEIVESLVTYRLVSRLNTLIPTYMVRASTQELEAR